MLEFMIFNYFFNYLWRIGHTACIILNQKIIQWNK